MEHFFCAKWKGNPKCSLTPAERSSLGGQNEEKRFDIAVILMYVGRYEECGQSVLSIATNLGV